MVTDWESRVRELEREGMTRSDAQAVADVEQTRNEKLEDIFNSANAEFWLYENNALAEMFGEAVREFIDGLNAKEKQAVIDSYAGWLEDHPEAAPHN